jgi:hypothetical protein
MTTNLSIEQIDAKLKEADNKDPNIRISYNIASAVDFLDVAINNDNGQLTTSIFHKPAAEPYILPYTSDHPRHVHRNIPYAALLRAARICSNVHDFNLERIRIDISLLLNEYPSVFITKHFNRFFELNNAMPVLNQLDAQVYHELHQKLLHQPTRREKQLQAMPTENDQIPEILQKSKPWDPNIMYAPYKFESGPRIAFQKEFRTWWHAYFVSTESNVAHVKVRFSIQSNQVLEHFLVHKKPTRETLTKKEMNTM